MDMDMVLHELREKCGEALEESGAKRTDLVDEIAQRFDALDRWMSQGKPAPGAWRETEDHR